VAEFIGTSNFLDGTVVGAENAPGLFRVRSCLGELIARSERALSTGELVTVSVRPENVELLETKPEVGTNVFPGTVDSKVFQGDFVDFQIRACGMNLFARTHPSLRTPVGEAVHMRLDADKCIVLAAD
jgi:iron(III) transport system ATP-binding protein